MGPVMQVQNVRTVEQVIQASNIPPGKNLLVEYHFNGAQDTTKILVRHVSGSVEVGNPTNGRIKGMAWFPIEKTPFSGAGATGRYQRV